MIEYAEDRTEYVGFSSLMLIFIFRLDYRGDIQYYCFLSRYPDIGTYDLDSLRPNLRYIHITLTSTSLLNYFSKVGHAC